MNGLLVERLDKSIARLQEQRAVSDGVTFLSHHREHQPMYECDLLKMENPAAQPIIKPGGMILKLHLYLGSLGRDDKDQHVPAQTLRPKCRSDAISSRHEQRYCSQSVFPRRIGVIENIFNDGSQVIVSTVCVKFLFD
jgi:hypothetical protein